MVEVSAKLNYAKLSAQKARIVVDEIRGMSVVSAIDILMYSTKKAASLVLKVLESAIANADHNESSDVDELRIAKIFVDEGPRAKRWRPRAKGRSSRIVKRTCHITVVVSDE